MFNQHTPNDNPGGDSHTDYADWPAAIEPCVAAIPSAVNPLTSPSRRTGGVLGFALKQRAPEGPINPSIIIFLLVR